MSPSALVHSSTTKPFQDGFTAADYGAAKNLFTQGQAAMLYLGAWEMGMAGDTNIPENVRNNLRAIQIPPANAGKQTDIVSWGGGRCVASRSKVKAEAIEFLKWMYKPENWTKKGMEMGLVIPCQKFDSYLTGKEGPLQKQIVDNDIRVFYLDAERQEVQERWKTELERMRCWKTRYWKLDFFALQTSASRQRRGR